MSAIISLLIFLSVNLTVSKSYKAIYAYESPIEISPNHMAVLRSDIISFSTSLTSIVYYENMGVSVEHFKIPNLPDTAIFQNSKCYILSNGQKTLMPFQNSTIKPMASFKNIKGYRCEKFSFKADDVTGECWVCKTLPKTITPVISMNVLPGAVLEYSVPDNGIIISLKTLVQEVLPVAIGK